MYAPKDKKELIVPVRLGLQSKFTFSCDKDMACFTKCCRDIYIILTPYDIIRIKNRLQMDSAEFLAGFTRPGKIDNTELPVPILKTLEDEEKTCPFLTKKEGCSIYDVRPATCRYYPIGAGIFHNKDEAADEKFFALIKEAHCLGHDLGEERTVAEWRTSQGLDDYDEVNAGWIEIILKRKSLGPFVTIPDKTLQMFFMGCYNLDAFRRFVFESRFLDVFDVPEDQLNRMKEDDAALLAFATKWLKKTFFGEGDLPIKEQVVEGDSIET